MKRKLITLLIFITICACKKSKDNERKTNLVESAVKDTLSSKLVAANKDGELVGFSVTITNDEELIYNEGFGNLDSKSKIKYDTNTIQNIGSVSKTFIGIALLKAVELGKLQLHDSINKYLPFEVVNPYYPNVPITILDLATHRSSILDYEENYLKGFFLKNSKIDKDEVAFSHFQKPKKNRSSLREFLEACFSQNGQWYSDKVFSKHQPGTKFEYSNFGADLCALVIAEATGMTFKDFVETYIFQPLGMYDSAWSLRDVDSTRRSKFYLFKDQKIADYEAITYPDGGLFTSSKDLSIFLMELIKGYKGSGSLLTNSGYQEFFKKRFDQNINGNGRINHGIFIEYNNDFIGSKDMLIGHNGSDFGSVAMMYFNPISGIGKIVMVNTDIDYKEDIVVPCIKEVWTSILEFEKEYTISL